ncbi:hypothetical protein [Elioraea sp.]|uniref:hypothetical protein n=1 Tax=Elioraea sp. TaxID=2185103 RepID=UPI00307ECAF6
MRSDAPALPAVGDVIRYAYLWSHEQAAGREEGSKDRPAAVVALVRQEDGHSEVVVLPITSTPPEDPGAAVEIPAETRARLGLQREPCWVVVTEYNRFVWPGPDLRPVEGGTGPFTYGPLPDRVMTQIRAAFAAWRQKRRVAAIQRTE